MGEGTEFVHSGKIGLYNTCIFSIIISFTTSTGVLGGIYISSINFNKFCNSSLVMREFSSDCSVAGCVDEVIVNWLPVVAAGNFQ